MPANLKMELAKTLHFDFNAGKKQLMRILKLPQETLDAMF